jgi:putative transposase
MAELMVGLAQYFAFYNVERQHQSLGCQTPDQVYSAGVGGGASIVDRLGDDDAIPQEKSSTGQRRPANEVEMGTAQINRKSVLTDGSTLLWPVTHLVFTTPGEQTLGTPLHTKLNALLAEH